VIPRRVVNLSLVALSAGAVVTVIVSMLGQPQVQPEAPVVDVPRSTPGASSPTPSPSPLRSDQRVYALSLSELSGLPPDARPGTSLQVWVAWEPPITRGPKIQLLVPHATLERIVPGMTPESPMTALLAVPVRAIPDVLYGDRYGALSVTLLR
jgi:hypothetical protein